MKVITLNDKMNFASNCYVLVSGGGFSVIDPSVSYERAAREFPDLEVLAPRYVILTHGHVDHFLEVESYVKRGCELLISELDGPSLASEYMNCSFIVKGKISSYNGKYRGLVGGDVINLGEDKLTVIETPGHTEGSICLLSENVIFTGDTLFARGSYGRCDLPTSVPGKLQSSLSRLFELDGRLIVYAGHGESCTLESTKSFFI